MLAFITGASSGLGEAFAGGLAADGWDLVITARRVDRMRAPADDLAGTGVQALACCPGLIDTEFHQVAGIDVAGIPFPVMPPAEVARAALAGLRFGEVVCVPDLGDQSMVGNVNDAQRALFMTAVSSGLAGRYQASRARTSR